MQLNYIDANEHIKYIHLNKHFRHTYKDDSIRTHPNEHLKYIILGIRMKALTYM